MRVIAGTARRIPLKTLPGLSTRPTQDRIKETLFNMLQTQLADASFLDLFAGSGGIGIEALSRGCRRAVFVENNAAALKIVEENLRAARLFERAQLLYSDFLAALRRLEPGEPFDLIFMDPPYGRGLERTALEYLKDSALITKDSTIIIEASLETSFAYLDGLGFVLEKQKKYKTSQHVFVYRGE